MNEDRDGILINNNVESNLLIDSKNNIHDNDHTEDKIEEKIKSFTSKKIVGYFLLFLVVMLSVLSAIWIKYITTDTKPILMTYINYSFLSFLIFINFIKNKIINYKKENVNDSETIDEDDKKEYQKSFHVMCIMLMIFWYFGNVFYNIGLTMTSVTSSETLSNVSIIFIFIQEIIIFKSKCSVYKIIGLILCAGGIALMAIFEATIAKDPKSDSILGDLMIVIGALSYSFYAITIKYYSKKHEKHFDMMEVFGYMGLYNFLILPIFILISHYTNLEKFELPSPMNLLYILINAIIAGFVADLCQSYCIVLLNAHIVSFGLILTSPLSYLYDSLLGNISLNISYVFGSVLIVSSLCVIFYENYQKIQKKKLKLKEEENSLK